MKGDRGNRGQGMKEQTERGQKVQGGSYGTTTAYKSPYCRIVFLARLSSEILEDDVLDYHFCLYVRLVDLLFCKRERVLGVEERKRRIEVYTEDLRDTYYSLPLFACSKK